MRDWDKPLGWGATFGLALLAMVSFHLAYWVNGCQLFFIAFFYALFRLANAKTSRRAFYIGLVAGIFIYTPHLLFFWNIFQSFAIALWLVLPCWLGLFLVLGRACLSQFGLPGWAWAAPFFWTGLEFFRSELYYLRFSWLNAGYSFSTSGRLHEFSFYGVYGIGFVLMSLAVVVAVFRRMELKAKWIAIVAAMAVLLVPQLVTKPQPAQSLRVTGVQLEFPSPAEAVDSLNKALRAHPDTDLFVLSEYTFKGPVPVLVKNWCRKHQKYLAAGGEEPISEVAYYNTAFVVSPEGQIVFQQGKCIPVQLINDGKPAVSQKVWASPWGKLGFGICYDASYTRVTDHLVRLGAQGLIFPTMDTVDWGGREHWLHARVAPLRAAEYAVPVFRLCSSGISQAVDASGQVEASAPFPGDGEMISAEMQLVKNGRIPWDRWLAWLSVGLTALAAVLMALEAARQRLILSVMSK